MLITWNNVKSHLAAWSPCEPRSRCSCSSGCDAPALVDKAVSESIDLTLRTDDSVMGWHVTEVIGIGLQKGLGPTTTCVGGPEP